MDANGRHLHLLDEEIQRVDGGADGGTDRRSEAGSDEQQLPVWNCASLQLLRLD